MRGSGRGPGPGVRAAAAPRWPERPRGPAAPRGALPCRADMSAAPGGGLGPNKGPMAELRPEGVGGARRRRPRCAGAPGTDWGALTSSGGASPGSRSCACAGRRGGGAQVLSSPAGVGGGGACWSQLSVGRVWGARSGTQPRGDGAGRGEGAHGCLGSQLTAQLGGRSAFCGSSAGVDREGPQLLPAAPLARKQRAATPAPSTEGHRLARVQWGPSRDLCVPQ